MQRRAFVKGLAAATASVQMWPELAQGVGHRLQTLRTDLDATLGDADHWQRVRKEFQLNPGLVHSNTGSVGAASSPMLSPAISTSWRATRTTMSGVLSATWQKKYVTAPPNSWESISAR